MNSSLPYSPSRQARMAKLNTIIEDESEFQRRSRRRAPSHAQSPVPSLMSTISSYYQSVRYSSDPAHWQWNELYDVSDDENVRPVKQVQRHDPPRLQVHIRPASGSSNDNDNDNNRDSWITDMTDSALPSPNAVIPSPRHWPTIDKMRQGQQGLLTPTQIPISPLALSMIPANPPAPSRTPSLDSLTSGDTTSSAPTSPDVGSVGKDAWNQSAAVAASDCSMSVYNDEEEISAAARLSTGVQLPQAALSFLENLSLEAPPMATEAPLTPVTPRVIGIKLDTDIVREMVEVPIKLSTEPAVDAIPVSATSEYSISQLSIPSPGGFLASLAPGAAHTWAIPAPEPDSTVAEQFYNAPWADNNKSQDAVREQVIELDVPVQAQGPVTAIKAQATPLTAKMVSAKDYDEAYQSDLRKAAEMSMDRTSSWLKAQCDFIDERLSGSLKPENNAATSPAHKAIGSDAAAVVEVPQPAGTTTTLHRRTSSAPLPKAKKAVKFVDTVKANQEYLKKTAPLSSGSNPLFYQAFQHVSNLSSPTDSFTARSARYDALQARRSSFSRSHADSVRGTFVAAPEPKAPVPQRPISILPGTEPEVTFEARAFAQAERERDAIDQVAPGVWVVEALRFLSGGRLLNSPAAGKLSNAPSVAHIAHSQVRVLDLGGQPTCDWAWHCAREFPHVKTYTASADSNLAADAAQLRGPSNHRLVCVENLWKLPFPDNHFDAISARSLFAHLKANQRIAGLNQDQLDATLAECMRVLRPGGYLEFFVLDAEVVRGGPRGSAASVEFGFKLRQRGYEPNPTKAWLGRVRRAGFTDIKRAWMFLPMGALRDTADGSSADMPDTPPPDAEIFRQRIQGAEAVRGPIGSSMDVAEVSGLVGSYLWERWILKLEAEMSSNSKSGAQLGANVGGIVEEGRKSGSGWRSLSGWARKPEAM